MQIVLRGVAARRKREFREQCHLAYSAAVLHSFAVHNPKQMPAFDKAFPDSTPKPAKTPDQIMAIMEAWTARAGATA